MLPNSAMSCEKQKRVTFSKKTNNLLKIHLALPRGVKCDCKPFLTLLPCVSSNDVLHPFSCSCTIHIPMLLSIFEAKMVSFNVFHCTAL